MLRKIRKSYAAWRSPGEEKTQNALNDRSRVLNGARIHILGVAYKKDIDDVRESPALDIMHLLMRRGAQVAYTDPYVPSVKVEGRALSSQDLDGAADVLRLRGYQYGPWICRLPISCGEGSVGRRHT